MTARRAREQQARDVRARDQQHDPDRGEQHVERIAHVPDDPLPKWLDRDPAATVALRESARLALGNDSEIRTRLLEGDPRAQPPDRHEVMHAAPL